MKVRRVEFELRRASFKFRSIVPRAYLSSPPNLFLGPCIYCFIQEVLSPAVGAQFPAHHAQLTILEVRQFTLPNHFRLLLPLAVTRSFPFPFLGTRSPVQLERFVQSLVLASTIALSI